MLKNKIIVLLIVIDFTFGSMIIQTGIATAETKNKACQKALLLAQKEALQRAGINIFTSFEKKQTFMSDGKIKTIINNSLQKSYGFVKTISKKEKVNFNPQTGYITCQIKGKFEIDTSKLKSQLLALSQKYNNQLEEENSKTKAIEEKNELLQKYEILKNNLLSTHSININKDSYNCGEFLTLNECKKELKEKIKTKFKNELAKKYNIDPSFIKVASIDLKNDIKVNYDDGLIVSYSGKVEGDVQSVKNPYIDEINSLNVFLGEKQIVDDNNEKITPKGPSFTEKLKSNYNNIVDFFSSKKQYFMINGFINIKGSDHNSYGDYPHHHHNSHISQFEYLINLKTKYYLKLTTGSASYKKTQTDENYDDDNYGEDIVKEDYSYKYTSVGLSTMILQAEGGSKSSIDIDYVVPFSQEGTKKVGNFFNIVWNNDLVITDNIVIGTGFVIGGEEAWKDNLWTVRLGIFF
jgi:hypothetical protein